MEQGHWFLSLYNDDGDPQEISFTAIVADDMTHNCPNGCSGKGECLMGHCQCQPGFGGDDCSESKQRHLKFNAYLLGSYMSRLLLMCDAIKRKNLKDLMHKLYTHKPTIPPKH